MSIFQAADTFLKDACGILGITKDSPLTVVTNTGCAALPALLNLKQVMMSRQVYGMWGARDELPVSFAFIILFDCSLIFTFACFSFKLFFLVTRSFELVNIFLFKILTFFFNFIVSD